MHKRYRDPNARTLIRGGSAGNADPRWLHSAEWSNPDDTYNDFYLGFRPFLNPRTAVRKEGP